MQTHTAFFLTACLIFSRNGKKEKRANGKRLHLFFEALIIALITLNIYMVTLNNHVNIYLTFGCIRGKANFSDIPIIYDELSHRKGRK